MKLSARSAAWLLLPLLLTGCIHKTQVAQNQPFAPPIEDTPPPKPEPSPTNLPPPVVTIPVQPEPQSPCSAGTSEEAARSTRRPANTNPQVASNGPCSAGDRTLSTGDPPNVRQQTDDSIASTEKGLNGITAANDQEKKTAAQIREFLKEAREALTAGDVDGAHNLATKAKVLLGELHP